jgi:hypothetical protein
LPARPRGIVLRVGRRPRKNRREDVTKDEP